MMQRAILYITAYTFLQLPLTAMCEDLNFESYCNSYADTAIQKYAKSLYHGCEFSSLRWNNDKQGQYEWCISVTKKATEKENKSRKLMLNNCLKEKYVADILPACIDNNEGYIPIKKIQNSSGVLKADYYSVISSAKGYIEYDFNSDNKIDNIFIEKKSDSLRIVQCISNNDKINRKYIRKIIPYNIPEWEAHSVGYTTSNIRIAKESPTNIVFEESYYENNSNGNSDAWKFQYNRKQKNFVLISYEGRRGKMHNDDEGGDSKLRLNFSQKEYNKSHICPYGDINGCISSEESGKIQAPFNILGNFNFKFPFYSKFNTETSLGPLYKLLTY